MESIAFRSAKRHVKTFARTSKLMQAHREAMDCRNCEDFLQLGVDAYEWLKRAEEALRENLYKGRRRNDPKLSEAFDMMYNTWLWPVEFADEWIAKQIHKGYIPDNLENFRKACDEVRDIVERRNWEKMASLSRASMPDDDGW